MFIYYLDYRSVSFTNVVSVVSLYFAGCRQVSRPIRADLSVCVRGSLANGIRQQLDGLGGGGSRSGGGGGGVASRSR